MKYVKFADIGISIRWFKKGNWFILPTIAVWKEGVLFAWMRLVLKICRFKLVELEKGEKREDLVQSLQRDFLRKQQALRIPLEEFKAFHRKDVVEFCEDAANKLKMELTTSRFYYLTCIYLDIVNIQNRQNNE